MEGDGRRRAGGWVLSQSYEARAPQMKFSSFYHQVAFRLTRSTHGVRSQRAYSMPANVSRRTRLTHVKRRSPAASFASECPAEPSVIDPLLFEGRVARSVQPARLEQLALQLWAKDYHELFALEYEENLRAVGGQGYDLAPTSYRARLHGKAAERYDQRRMRQQRDEMAIALHSNNQQHWSASLLARSVSYFNLASAVIQKEETRQRRLASRPTTFNFLRMMRDCRCVLQLLLLHSLLLLHVLHALRVRQAAAAAAGSCRRRRRRRCCCCCCCCCWPRVACGGCSLM